MDNPQKNILYISYDGMTDPLGQSQVIPYIQGLSEIGYKFTLLSCEKKDRYEKNRDLINSILLKAGISWVPILYHKKPAVLSTLYDIICLNKKAKALHLQKKFQLIHCRSYISALVGLRMYKKYKLPFIFDMRGFYADERVDGGLWELSNPLYNIIYKYFKKKEKDFLKFAAVTISLTNAGKKVLEAWQVCKENKTKIEVIPCASDFTLFSIASPEEKSANKNIYKIPQDAFVLSYLGSTGTWYMMEEMLDFFKIVLSKKPNALFLILTSDNREEILAAAKRKNIAQEKIIIDFAKRDEVAKKSSIADLGIFFIKPCFSKLASSPTKMGELLAMGMPLICNDAAGDVKEILAYTKGGFIISSFTDEEYEKVFQKYISETDSLNSEKIRNAAKEFYGLEKSVKKYSDVYTDILKS